MAERTAYVITREEEADQYGVNRPVPVLVVTTNDPAIAHAYMRGLSMNEAANKHPPTFGVETVEVVDSERDALVAEVASLRERVASHTAWECDICASGSIIGKSMKRYERIEAAAKEWKRLDDMNAQGVAIPVAEYIKARAALRAAIEGE